MSTSYCRNHISEFAPFGECRDCDVQRENDDEWRDLVRSLMAQLATTRDLHMEAVAERDALLSQSASVADITRAVREADQAHQTSGGGTRHYVMECLLPALAAEGLSIVKTAVVRDPADPPAEHDCAAPAPCPTCGPFTGPTVEPKKADEVES